jgi:hypothetical protein
MPALFPDMLKKLDLAFNDSQNLSMMDNYTIGPEY